jgi:hypothetical protein
MGREEKRVGLVHPVNVAMTVVHWMELAMDGTKGVQYK